jgi:hypothetical protein
MSLALTLVLFDAATDAASPAGGEEFDAVTTPRGVSASAASRRQEAINQALVLARRACPIGEEGKAMGHPFRSVFLEA